uniref:Uncharacterized protein n=1 Tax=virus sp. ct0sl4 TaxID=2826788 RepID=A0A8S5MPN4_9VIRU|nr:MAG TPA: hypothetical protein [virus sp. ct0sl4]
MATLTLNNGIGNLDPESSLGKLYGRIFDMMRGANNVETTDYTQPPYTVDGIPDTGLISAKVAEESEVMMKNAAFDWANLLSTSGIGGGGSAGGCILRAGDSMRGLLGALYGFKAGYDGVMIFETIQTPGGTPLAHVAGDLQVDGKLDLSDTGIYFNKHQSIYYGDGTLKIDSPDIGLKGDVTVDGTSTLGDVVIDSSGIHQGTHEYYHSGNSNKADVDWTMHDAYVEGDLHVKGDQHLGGRLVALHGFDLGENNVKVLYSAYDATGDVVSVHLDRDLEIATRYGVKIGGKYIVKERGVGTGIISLCAPGMTLNLGDSDGVTATSKMTLQSDLFIYSGDYAVVTKEGAGCFKNGLLAGCGNAGSTVMSTYSGVDGDCGVTFQKKIRLGTDSGPALFAGSQSLVDLTIPYTHTSADGVPVHENIALLLDYEPTTSLLAAQDTDWSATFCFDTEAEMFAFKKPVESGRFSIISNKCKTYLGEGVLFFNDGIFIEGVADGMAFTGNAYFNGDVGTQRFASGFAGYGWGIHKDPLTGDYHATFDGVIIRKKARFYELEVQKMSVTNGSLWVTDSCSGDIVTAIA